MAIEIWVNIGPGNGLLPDGTKAITWTNVDLLSTKSCDIHLRANSHEMLKISTLDVSLKISNVRLHMHLPGTNELNDM